MVCNSKWDKWKTAFSITSGHYQYRVMLYGMACALSMFQCFINEILRDFLGKFVIAFIDDILIYYPSKSSHVSHVNQILERLKENHLFVSTVTFVGYMISDNGVTMDEVKLTAVRPTLRAIHELQRFTGFARFYRRFIGSFGSIAAPLTLSLKGNAKKIRRIPSADHKNLEYLPTAKRLNSRQAH